MDDDDCGALTKLIIFSNQYYNEEHAWFAFKFRSNYKNQNKVIKISSTISLKEFSQNNSSQTKYMDWFSIFSQDFKSTIIPFPSAVFPSLLFCAGFFSNSLALQSPLYLPLLLPIFSHLPILAFFSFQEYPLTKYEYESLFPGRYLRPCLELR